MAELYLLLPAFMLVLARVSGIMLAAPFFSAAAIPTQVKAVLVLAMSMAVFPLVATPAAVPVGVATAMGGIVGELAVGLLIGLGLSLVFMAAQVAGEIVGHQSGMMLGVVYNPMLEDSTGLLEQLYSMIVLLVFLAVVGHRSMIRALLDSFASVPPMSFRPEVSLVDLLVGLLSSSLEMAIRIAGPVILALLLALLTLGFVSRTMPQLNILTVGFPLKLALALFVMALTMMSLEPVLIGAFDSAVGDIRQALGLAAEVASTGPPGGLDGHA